LAGRADRIFELPLRKFVLGNPRHDLSVRLRADSHRKPPHKIGRRLNFFDYVTCNKCIPVCPNDANFSVAMPSTPQVPVTMTRQIVNFADFCNECGDCDVFCLEDGGPYLFKPRLFVNRERWLRDALLAPGEAKPVSEFLRCEAAG
jgi:hypothetical protein